MVVQKVVCKILRGDLEYKDATRNIERFHQDMQCRVRAFTDKIYLSTNLSSLEMKIIHKRVETLEKRRKKRKKEKKR